MYPWMYDYATVRMRIYAGVLMYRRLAGLLACWLADLLTRRLAGSPASRPDRRKYQQPYNYPSVCICIRLYKRPYLYPYLHLFICSSFCMSAHPSGCTAAITAANEAVKRRGFTACGQYCRKLPYECSVLPGLPLQSCGKASLTLRRD
jgi:hypothetical protein